MNVCLPFSCVLGLANFVMMFLLLLGLVLACFCLNLLLCLIVCMRFVVFLFA